MSFDDGGFIYEVFKATIEVHDVVTSNEPDKAQLMWARLDEWLLFKHDADWSLTRSSMPILHQLRQLEAKCQRLPAVPSKMPPPVRQLWLGVPWVAVHL